MPLRRAAASRVRDERSGPAKAHSATTAPIPAPPCKNDQSVHSASARLADVSSSRSSSKQKPDAQSQPMGARLIPSEGMMQSAASSAASPAYQSGAPRERVLQPASKTAAAVIAAVIPNTKA